MVALILLIDLALGFLGAADFGRTYQEPGVSITDISPRLIAGPTYTTDVVVRNTSNNRAVALKVVEFGAADFGVPIDWVSAEDVGHERFLTMRLEAGEHWLDSPDQRGTFTRDFWVQVIDAQGNIADQDSVRLLVDADAYILKKRAISRAEGLKRELMFLFRNSPDTTRLAERLEMLESLVAWNEVTRDEVISALERTLKESEVAVQRRRRSVPSAEEKRSVLEEWLARIGGVPR